MFLNLLPFIYIDLGRNDYLIYGKTTFDVPKAFSVGILPNETEGFTFEDSDNNIYTDFPIILTSYSHLIITPSQETKTKNISIIAAPIYKECKKSQFVLDGFMMTNETIGYYAEPICYIFMNPNFDNISLQVTSNTTGNRLTYGTGESPALRYYYEQINASTATLMIQELRIRLVQMTMIDRSVFTVGDFEISFKDEYEFHIPPNSVFVAHTIKGYTFESDKEPIADGVFFDKDSRYSIKAKKPGNNTIVGSVSVINSYVPCTELNVEIVRNETSTIFGVFDTDYTMAKDSTFCHVFTYPVPRRYKFVTSGRYIKFFITTPNSTYDISISDGTGYPYINKSVVYYLTVDSDVNLKSGLEQTNIVTPYHDIPDCRDAEILKIYGKIQRNPKPTESFKLPDGPDNVNYFSGTYQINIPAGGTKLKFQINSIVVFHNAYSFKAFLDNDPVLHYTGNYVFNFTDKVTHFEIIPAKNQSLIGNISVLFYDYTYQNPATTADVIVVSPNHPIPFIVTKSTYEETNLTYDKHQVVKFNVFASSAFYYTKEARKLYNHSEYRWYGNNSEEHEYRYSEFGTVTTNEPETNEISGLFRGALSYTDLNKAHFYSYYIQDVYTYGNKYYPPDDYYNYPKSEISAGAIVGIVFATIIVIAAVAIFIVVCIRRRRRRSNTDVSYSEVVYSNENDAAQEQIYAKYDRDDSAPIPKAEKPAPAKTPSLETPLNPNSPPPPVYIIVQPGQPSPSPNPYT